MQIIQSFKVKQITTDKYEYEVLVKTMGLNEEVNITDVGFGVSQVLPVLVQCFYAPPDSTIIIEQPEIHLHPSVQATLADLFIEALQARINGKVQNTQLLIESHSEHFLRRLQRRIAEKVISPENIAIYFCESSPNGSLIKPLEVDMFGYIKNWPKDFFGDEMGDIVAQTEAALQSRDGE